MTQHPWGQSHPSPTQAPTCSQLSSGTSPTPGLRHITPTPDPSQPRKSLHVPKLRHFSQPARIFDKSTGYSGCHRLEVCTQKLLQGRKSIRRSSRTTRTSLEQLPSRTFPPEHGQRQPRKPSQELLSQHWLRVDYFIWHPLELS